MKIFLKCLGITLVTVWIGLFVVAFVLIIQKDIERKGHFCGLVHEKGDNSVHETPQTMVIDENTILEFMILKGALK